MRANLLRSGATLLLATIFLPACNQNQGGTTAGTDTPTGGAIAISVDETFAPVIKSEVDTFQKLYQNAKVTAYYKPEQEAVQDLMSDKVRLAILTRELNAAERAEFDRLQLVPKATKIATDGLAIIVHPSNPDSLLSIPQLRDIFTGKIQQWSQVSGKKALGTINVVFDANRSSTTRYIQDSVARGTALTTRAFAAKSNSALLEYVAKNPNAIGVVGANWISDRDDPKVEKFLQDVRVVGVSTQTDPPNIDDYVQPYQAYLALKTYPLTRTVYIVSREARAGLGTGFTSFVAGNQGQLIILKSGLLPAIGQMRVMNTNKL